MVMLWIFNQWNRKNKVYPWISKTSFYYKCQTEEEFTAKIWENQENLIIQKKYDTVQLVLRKIEIGTALFFEVWEIAKGTRMAQYSVKFHEKALHTEQYVENDNVTK